MTWVSECERGGATETPVTFLAACSLCYPFSLPGQRSSKEACDSRLVGGGGKCFDETRLDCFDHKTRPYPAVKDGWGSLVLWARSWKVYKGKPFAKKNISARFGGLKETHPHWRRTVWSVGRKVEEKKWKRKVKNNQRSFRNCGI